MFAKQDEKLHARAVKFGLVSDSLVTNDEDEQKRKARAERFKLDETVSSKDEEEKRKIRLARFAPTTTAESNPIRRIINTAAVDSNKRAKE